MEHRIYRLKAQPAVWDDDRLMFADIRSPQSVQNIEQNPSVEVNVVDPLVRKGYRFKGRRVVDRSDDVLQRGCRIYRGAGVMNEIRAVVLIRLDRALPLISPAYDRGETEEQIKDRWRRYWGKLWEGVLRRMSLPTSRLAAGGPAVEKRPSPHLRDNSNVEL
jgi:hypothetical protein